MTDGSGWQSPSGPNEQPTSPVYGAAQPGYSQQTPGYSAAAPGGWTPPPKPGLIPLRPLSFGTILGSSFRVIRRNPAPTFGLSVLLYGFITIVYVAVLGGVVALFVTRMSTSSIEDDGAIFAGSIGLIAVSSLVPVGLAVVAGGILQGIISLEVSRATLGEKLRIRGLWRLARGRFAALIGWSLLLTAVLIGYILIASLAIGLVFGFVGIASQVNSDTAGVETAIGAVIGAFLVAAVIGLAFTAFASWIGIKVSLVPSAIMLERLTVRQAVVRSWQLTNQNFWRTFGTQLLISVIISTASQVISTPISVIAGLVLGLTNPSGDPSGSIVAAVVIYLVLGIVTVVVGAIGLVTQTSALTLIYIDIRMRKEGLDLELLHFIEAKNAGAVGVANPYVRDATAATARPAGTAAPAGTGSPWA